MSKYSKVYHKMLLSYSVLTVMMTLLIGATAAFLFSDSYQREMRRMDQQLMDQAAYNIQLEVFGRTLTLSNDLMLGSSSEPVSKPFSAKSESTDYYHSYQQIFKVFSQNSDLIADISFYYANRNVIVSAVQKIKYLDTRHDADDICAFAHELKTNTEVSRWISVDTNPGLRENSIVQPDACMLYVVPYYKNPSGGYLVIQVRKEMIQQILDDFYGNRETEFWLISPENEPMLQTGTTVWSEDKNPLIPLADDLGNGETAFQTYDSHVVAVKQIPDTGFCLVKWEDAGYFNAQLPQNTILLLSACAAALLCGFIFALFSSKYFYHPVQNLLQEACASLKEASDRFSGENSSEFSQISSLINHAAEELDIMKQKQKENHGQLKQRLAANFLYGISDARKIREDAEHLGIPVDFPYYCVYIIKADRPAGLAELEFGKRYPGRLFLAAALSENTVGLVTGYLHGERDEIQVSIFQILDEYSSPDSVVCVGSETETLCRVNQSFAHARAALDYQFFFPEEKILMAEYFLSRTNRLEGNAQILEDLENALNKKDMAQAEHVLESFVELCRNSNYSAEICHQLLLDFLRKLARYGRVIGFHFDQDLYDTAMELQNINDFRAYFLDCCQRIFAFAESEHKCSLRIEEAKNYISKHYHEDISQLELAEIAGCSPSYFSKIFKEETGENFVEYLNRVRLVKAAELLQRDLSVSEIALQTGFKSASYFNKKFKEFFGVPPTSYHNPAGPSLNR